MLLCWLIPMQKGTGRKNFVTMHSALGCFSKAACGNVQSVSIIFPVRDVSCHAQVIELCQALKTSPLTQQVHVSVFMEKPHQKLILEFQEAGVDSVDFYTSGLPASIEETIYDLWKNDSFTPIKKVLKALCPFLEYIRSRVCYDFPVCGAYRNRMVLGGSRLQEVCNTPGHQFCNFYQHPKVAK